MSGIRCQTRVDAAQFDGLGSGTGLFTFKHLQEIARTTRVVITAASYTELNAGPALTTNIQFWAVKPGGIPTEKITLGEGEAANGLLNVNGNARLRLCGIVLPREPGDNGEHWDIQAITQLKTQTGTVCIDYVLCPYPESHERGSPDK